MQFINLTPHTVVIYENGRISNALPSAGNARVTVLPEQPEMIDGIPVLPPVQYGDVTGLPDSQPHTLYIVSLVVAIAMTDSGRRDLVIPAWDPSNVIRNAEGHIIGVKALRRG